MEITLAPGSTVRHIHMHCEAVVCNSYYVDGVMFIKAIVPTTGIAINMPANQFVVNDRQLGNKRK